MYTLVTNFHNNFLLLNIIQSSIFFCWSRDKLHVAVIQLFVTSPNLQVETETAAEDIVHDLADYHHDERRDEQEPAHRQQHKGHLVQGVVAVRLQAGVPELDVMDRVVVAQRRAEAVHILLSEGLIEAVVDPVTHHPPGHRDQPQHDQDHRHDVVHEVAPELTKTPHHLIAESLFDALAAFIDGDAKDENDGDSDASGDEVPGQVRLCRTVGILGARLLCVDGAKHNHQDEDREAEDVQNSYTHHFSLLPVRKEAAATFTQTHLDIFGTFISPL